MEVATALCDSASIEFVFQQTVDGDVPVMMMAMTVTVMTTRIIPCLIHGGTQTDRFEIVQGMCASPSMSVILHCHLSSPSGFLGRFGMARARHHRLRAYDSLLPTHKEKETDNLSVLRSSVYLSPTSLRWALSARSHPSSDKFLLSRFPSRQVCYGPCATPAYQV
jgi:hypothetical protein